MLFLQAIHTRTQARRFAQCGTAEFSCKAACSEPAWLVLTTVLPHCTYPRWLWLALPVMLDPIAGLDIARLVAQQAAAVYVCAREWRTPQDLEGPAVPGCVNTLRRGMISRLSSTGAIWRHLWLCWLSCVGQQQLGECGCCTSNSITPCSLNARTVHYASPVTTHNGICSTYFS